MSTEPDVIVIGAGPAGLSVARCLHQRQIRPLLLEAGASAGWSWRSMPENISLLSPFKVNSLPGTAVRWRDRYKFHACHDFAGYLMEYARDNQVAIRTDTRVSRVARQGNGYVVHTDSGDFVAPVVINATGYFNKRNTPSYPGQDTTRVRQMHVGQYRSADQVKQLLGSDSGRVLVVGRRISAGQTIDELHTSGLDVAVSTRGPITFARELWVQHIAFRFFYVYEDWRIAREPHFVEDTYPPMPAGNTKRLIRSGEVPQLPDIRAFERDAVLFSDGRREPFDLVVYATGFLPALDHLSGLVDVAPPSMQPELDDCESTSHPGLFFLGLDQLRSMRSRYLRGIREDAAHVAARVESRLRQIHADAAGHAGRSRAAAGRESSAQPSR